MAAWVDTFDKAHEPTLAQVDAYVGSDLWMDINAYLQEAYQAKPALSYSGCSVPGWNLKYKKGGKALCTLYPMEGWYIALVVVGEKEKVEVELLMPTFTETIQDMYENGAALMGATWLMVQVQDARTLNDVKRLIAIRRAPAKAAG